MKPSVTISLFLLFLLILYLGFGCIKHCDSPTNGYIFVLPHTVAPVKSVYKVGDTVHVSADFSHYMMESRGEYFLLENLSVGLAFGLYDLLDSIPSSVVRGFSNCEILLEDNTNLFLDGLGPRGEYNYSQGRYWLDFKFRPLKPGFYALVQHSLYSSISQGLQIDFPGKCGNRTRVRAYVNLNDGADNNYHLLEDDHVHLFTQSWINNKKNFYKDGGFLFYVEE
jgi:hypothetical protein